MRITYRTLKNLIEKMNEDQLDSDVTVELPTESTSECYAADLRIAGEEHDGGLVEGHPVLYVHLGEAGERMDNVDEIAQYIAL